MRKVPCDQKTAVFGIETGFKYIKNKKGGMIQKRIKKKELVTKDNVMVI